MFINWAPPSEMSRLVGFAATGTNIGNAIGLTVSGYLCLNGFDDGWGSIFWFFGNYMSTFIYIQISVK
jgi:hypothetical protein